MQKKQKLRRRTIKVQNYEVKRAFRNYKASLEYFVNESLQNSLSQALHMENRWIWHNNSVTVSNWITQHSRIICLWRNGITLQRCMNACKCLCTHHSKSQSRHSHPIWGFLCCDEWTSINSPLSEEKNKFKMPERQVLQSRFAFTEQHLSITSDLTPGLEKVAVVSGCM